MKQRKYFVRVIVSSHVEDSEAPDAMPEGAILNCQETRTLASEDLTLLPPIACELAQNVRSAFHRSVRQYIRRHGGLDK